MKKLTLKQIENIINDTGNWSFTHNEKEHYYELEMGCDNGMDYQCTIYYETKNKAQSFYNNLKKDYENYDADQECRLQINAYDFISVRQALEDCEQVEERLDYLVREIEREMEN